MGLVLDALFQARDVIQLLETFGACPPTSLEAPPRPKNEHYLLLERVVEDGPCQSEAEAAATCAQQAPPRLPDRAKHHQATRTRHGGDGKKRENLITKTAPFWRSPSEENLVYINNV